MMVKSIYTHLTLPIYNYFGFFSLSLAIKLIIYVSVTGSSTILPVIIIFNSFY
jgi:hypothetical protein